MKKRDTAKENKPASAKRGQKRGTVKVAESGAAEKSGKKETPKRRSGTLRGAARRVKQAIPDIVDRMVEEAKNGNVQHLKTVLHCTGVDKLLEQECQPRKQKSLAELLIRRLETQKETGESEASGTESE